MDVKKEFTMDTQKPEISAFLELVLSEHGESMRDACKAILLVLPDGQEFYGPRVLAQARQTLQEPLFHQAAAMNASPFDSAEDRDF
jgi:hypothetical protein